MVRTYISYLILINVFCASYHFRSNKSKKKHNFLTTKGKYTKNISIPFKVRTLIFLSPRNHSPVISTKHYEIK